MPIVDTSLTKCTLVYALLFCIHIVFGGFITTLTILYLTHVVHFKYKIYQISIYYGNSSNKFNYGYDAFLFLCQAFKLFPEHMF